MIAFFGPDVAVVDHSRPALSPPSGRAHTTITSWPGSWIRTSSPGLAYAALTASAKSFVESQVCLLLPPDLQLAGGEFPTLGETFFRIDGVGFLTSPSLALRFVCHDLNLRRGPPSSSKMWGEVPLPEG